MDRSKPLKVLLLGILGTSLFCSAEAANLPPLVLNSVGGYQPIQGTDNLLLASPVMTGTPTINSFTAASLGANQVFSAAQRVTIQTITIATSSFIPNFNTGSDFIINLSSACSCTVANPSTTPVAGQHGVIYIVQDATGGRAVGTWGSDYISPGGTASLSSALSTGANDIDVISYAVKDSTHIVLSLGAVNVSH